MVRDDVRLTWPAGTTWAGWTRTFLPANLDAVTDVREAVARATGAADEALDKMAWLGLFDDDHGPEGLEGTPAQIVEALVTVKWVLGADDRDMIVMWHKFEYDLHGERKAKTSSLSLEGKDSTFTAMSDTVGLPMALAVKPMLKAPSAPPAWTCPCPERTTSRCSPGWPSWALCLKNARSRPEMWAWVWPWCWACMTCSGAPEWPAQGQVHEAWVREAIAWRMQVGLDACPDVVPALDAWTLEWLSQSEEVHVDVNTADWPFLAYAPELQTVLVQRLALVELANAPSRQVDVVRDVRRVARRSEGLWNAALGRAFDSAEGLARRRDQTQQKED